MKINYKRTTYMLTIAFVLSLLVTIGVLAGNVDSPGAPGATNSYTLEDIYQRLTNGTAGSQSTFTEPAAGPGTGTMYTLNEIMAAAPEVDDTDGALPEDVLAGKTFWGLTSGAWGTQTGTLYGGCTCEGTLYASRWCDNGDGTVTDLTTCLVWLQKADWGGQKPWRSNTSDDYDDAHTRAGILKAGTGGANLSDGSVEGDWRLPTKTELAGLVNGSPQLRCASGSCDLYGFTGIQSGIYWSSTTNASNSGYAWKVAMDDGSGGSILKWFDSSYVWPVRSGE